MLVGCSSSASKSHEMTTELSNSAKKVEQFILNECDYEECRAAVTATFVGDSEEMAAYFIKKLETNLRNSCTGEAEVAGISKICGETVTRTTKTEFILEALEVYREK